MGDLTFEGELALRTQLTEANQEIDRLRAKVSDMRSEAARDAAKLEEAWKEANWRIENETRAAGERDKAIALYETLTHEQREKVPEQLRVWLRYRSEKYFGPQRTPP